MIDTISELAHYGLPMGTDALAYFLDRGDFSYRELKLISGYLKFGIRYCTDNFLNAEKAAYEKADLVMTAYLKPIEEEMARINAALSSPVANVPRKERIF